MSEDDIPRGKHAQTRSILRAGPEHRKNLGGHKGARRVGKLDEGGEAFNLKREPAQGAPEYLQFNSGKKKGSVISAGNVVKG